MKEFSEFTKEDQKLICEAMSLNNEAVLNGVSNSEQFEDVVATMSQDARAYLITILESYLPEEYK